MSRQLTITGNEICAGVAQWLKAAKESPADASSPAAGAASGLTKMQVDLTETKVDLGIERGGRGPRGTLPMHHPAISRRYLAGGGSRRRADPRCRALPRGAVYRVCTVRLRCPVRDPHGIHIPLSRIRQTSRDMRMVGGSR